MLSGGADGMGQEPLLASLKGEDVAAGRRLREVKRVLLDSSAGCYGCVVPKGAWHTVEVLAPFWTNKYRLDSLFGIQLFFVPFWGELSVAEFCYGIRFIVLVLG